MSLGIMCMAQNNSTTNYLLLAYAQRLSLRLTNPRLPYAVVTDQQSLDTLTPAQRQAFDHVILLDTDWAKDQDWKQKNDWQLFKLTPFRETIKVESDLLFTRDISHWWPVLRHRDLVLSLGCVNHKGQPSQQRNYRKIFDLNCLPDTYSGLMYWRRSQLAHAFFHTASKIYGNWDHVKSALIACNDPGSNDLVFAISARIHGENLCTLPAADFFRMTHMKPAHLGLPESKQWHHRFNVEVSPPHIRINGIDQTHPFHYVDKNWMDQNLIQRYEHVSEH
jgi:hypothetical protein